MDLGAITIRCDHDGCEVRLATGTSSPHRAREVARREGWATRLTRDAYSRAVEYCPEHAADHAHDTVPGGSF